MKMLFLTVLMVLNFHPAKQVPVKEEAPVKTQLNNLQFIKLYVERLRQKTNSPEQDMLDLMAVSTAIDQFGYTFAELGTSEAEMIIVHRKITIAYILKAIKKLEQPGLSRLDKKIAEGEVSDCVHLLSLTAEELGITEEKRQALLLRE